MRGIAAKQHAARVIALGDKLAAEEVTPTVVWLAHEDCPVTGEIYTAGAGRFARLFIASTEGYVHAGGKPTIGAFKTDHKMAFFTGANLEATLETPKIQLTPGYRSLVQEVSLSGDLDPTDVSVQVGVADRRGQATTWSSEYMAESDGTGIFKTLDDGRFHQFRVNIPEGTDWNSLAGIDDQESVWTQTGRS